MKINKLTLLALLGVFILNSCSNDDDNLESLPEGDYTDGFFVLNEGNFGKNNSSLSFVNNDFTTIQNDVFFEVNATSLGDTAQSITFDDNYAYIVLNVSNIIQVVDRYTLERVATIEEGLSNPRYTVIVNDKLYVTNWGDASVSTDDYVAVYQIDDYSLSTTISVEEGPEKIVSKDDKLYVALKGGYNFNNKIEIINTVSNTVESSVIVGDVPNSIKVQGDYLWVNSSGLPSYSGNESAGSISKINLNTGKLEITYEFSEVTEHPNFFEIEEEKAYYTLAGSVYSFDISSTVLPTESLIDLVGVINIYGFDVENNLIYISDALNYTEGGEVKIYNLEGVITSEFKVGGIAPNGFYFN